MKQTGETVPREDSCVEEKSGVIRKKNRYVDVKTGEKKKIQVCVVKEVCGRKCRYVEEKTDVLRERQVCGRSDKCFNERSAKEERYVR